MAEILEAPGRAVVTRCGDCDGKGSAVWDGETEECLECGGLGLQLWHACVRCGDRAMWHYADSERTEMACRLCGERWTETDPRWLAQRIPDRLLPAAA